jgi:hypothetical protein
MSVVQEEVVKWVSRIGSGGCITGAIQVQASEGGRLEDVSTRPPTSQETERAEGEPTMAEGGAHRQRPQPSALLADLKRSQIRLDVGGSVHQVATVVGGVAVNRYGQALARIDQVPPIDGEPEDAA